MLLGRRLLSCSDSDLEPLIGIFIFRFFQGQMTRWAFRVSFRNPPFQRSCLPARGTQGGRMRSVYGKTRSPYSRFTAAESLRGGEAKLGPAI